MTQAPSSLNVEYVLLRSGDFLGSLKLHELPWWVSIIIQDILIVGMVLSMMFIILTVYALIRLHQVEHEGFHKKELAEHAVRDEEVLVPRGNERWERIVTLSSGTAQGDWRRAILEADIMLFDVLHNNGYPGDTVGEQLRGANPLQMTTLDLAWKAHKVRNDIAHQGESTPLTERDARMAIGYYKRVFEEFGAI